MWEEDAQVECWNCGRKHKPVRLGGACPAKGINCGFCERVGHYKVKCGAYKQSQKKEKDQKV